MSDDHLFKVGQRVRPSEYGISRNIFLRGTEERTGVVVKVGMFNTPYVLWDGRKTASFYHPSFIEADEQQ